jgi:hypothetical protein
MAIDYLRLTALRLWKLFFVLWQLDMREAATEDKVQPPLSLALVKNEYRRLRMKN